MLLKSIHVLSDPAEFLQNDAQITPGSTTQTHNIVLFSHFNLKVKQPNWGSSLVCLSRSTGSDLFKRLGAEGGGLGGRGGSLEGSASLQKDVCELRGVPVLERSHI